MATLPRAMCNVTFMRHDPAIETVRLRSAAQAAPAIRADPAPSGRRRRRVIYLARSPRQVARMGIRMGTAGALVRGVRLAPGALCIVSRATTDDPRHKEKLEASGAALCDSVARRREPNSPPKRSVSHGHFPRCSFSRAASSSSRHPCAIRLYESISSGTRDLRASASAASANSLHSSAFRIPAIRTLTASGC